jgi:predicted short-subunit dehydrogenase-like oxidoreductase (DUF2520 family)
MTTLKMTLAVVGTGRTGTALAKGLREAGWQITSVATPSLRTARQTVAAIGGGRAYGILTRLVLEAGTILICTPDIATPDVTRRLAEMGGEEWSGKVVLHTSGAFDRHALDRLEALGAATGSVYPLCILSRKAKPQFHGMPFAVEGDAVATRVAGRMARDLGGFVLQLETGERAAYLAAATLVRTHVLALVESAAKILTDLGLSRRQTTKSLLELVQRMLQIRQRYGAREVWDGVLDDGALHTTAQEVRALRRYPAEYANAYAALQRLAERIAVSRVELNSSSAQRGRRRYN